MLTPKDILELTVTGANPGNNFSNEEFLNGDAIINYLNQHGIRVVGAIDGAKAPFDYTVNGLPNDAYASNLMRDLLEGAFANIDVLDDWQIAFETVIDLYADDFEQVRKSYPHFANEDYRYFNGACAFAIAIIDENTGDCVLLQGTDCYAVVQQKGQFKNLSNYDEEAVVNSGMLNRYPLLSDWLNQGKSMDEAQKLERQRVLGNRKRVYNNCQTPNNMGMAVMNGDKALLQNMQVDKFNLKNTGTEALVLMSDGFMCKHDDIVYCAKSAVNTSPTFFYVGEILPLWGQTIQDVMTDVTCVVVYY